jgi:hypothetical protein
VPGSGLESAIEATNLQFCALHDHRALNFFANCVAPNQKLKEEHVFQARTGTLMRDAKSEIGVGVIVFYQHCLIEA